MFDFCEFKYITKTQENLYIFETGVKNPHIYHLMSAFGSPKWVLHKQRTLAFSAILSFLFYRNYGQTTGYDEE